MTQKVPAGRPALRKSVDAALHPALAGRGPQTIVTTRPAPQQSGKPAAAPAAPAKPLAKARRAATSDSLRPTKSDPAVTIKVTMPKSLRKRVRSLAKQQGIDPEVMAARLIAEALAR